MNTQALVAPSKESLSTEAGVWSARVKEMRIVDAASCQQASFLLRSIKGIRSDIATWFAPFIEAAMETKRKADAARKGLVDEKDRIEAPLVVAEAAVKRALLDWEATQERVRKEQERELQAEAQRRAEAATLDAAASLEREAVTTGNVEMLQEAHDLMEQPIEAPVVSVGKMTPKVQGVSYRSTWKAHDVIDVKALAGAVAAGTAPASFLAPNVTAINQFARATQGMQPVAGVRFFEERQIAARG